MSEEVSYSDNEELGIYAANLFHALFADWFHYRYITSS